MAVEAFLVSQFVAAGAMLLLAGWLLWLNFRGTVNRAFAVYLLFRAVVILANRFKGLAEAAGDARGIVFWETIREYYLLALAPTLLYFWVAYSKARRQQIWRIAIIGGAILVEGLYFTNHCFDLCSEPSGLVRLGPLAPLATPGHLLVMGLVGLWVLRDALRSAPTPRGKAAFPVAIGLLAIALVEASVGVGLLMRLGPKVVLGFYEPASTAWVYTFYGVFLGALGPPLVGLAWTIRASFRDEGFRAKAQVLGVLSTLTAASGLYVGWNVTLGVDWLPGIFLLGLWRILPPALVAYSLVRHRLFGVEVRLKWTLVRATMAFTFLGVFFVASQLAQNYLSNAYGWSFGGIAAGLLLFAISPIQRTAERFTQAVLPSTRPVASLTHPERLDLFRHQAFLVWSDGTMGRKERALLDGLRQQLAIPLEAATRIEAEAAADPGHAPPPGRGSPAK